MNLTPKEYAEDLFLYYFELLSDGLYSDFAARQEAKRFATKAAEEARKAELNVLVKFNIVSSNFKSNYFDEVIEK